MLLVRRVVNPCPTYRASTYLIQTTMSTITMLKATTTASISSSLASLSSTNKLALMVGLSQITSNVILLTGVTL